MPQPDVYREHERYAFLTEEVYDSAWLQLAQQAEDLGQDDKTSYFFVLPDQNLSIATTPQKSVIKLKDGQIGHGIGFEEMPEVELIDSDEAANAVKLFEALTDHTPQVSEQFRHNFMLDGVEIAMKYTETWGFHAEFERLYRADSDAELETATAEADERIGRVAGKLGIALATDAELVEFNESFKRNGKPRGEYTNEELRQLYGSLFKLATLGQLPEQQRLDEPTLAWIAQHRPEEMAGEPAPLDLSESEKKIVSNLELPAEWFPAQERRESLHGQLHLARVAALASQLARHAGRTDAEARSVFIAGLVHDIRRTHDQDEPTHAAASAQWYSEHQSEINALLGDMARDVDEEIVRDAITHHDGADTVGHEHQWAIDCLRAADALDRYRQPKLKWWLNDAYLSVKPSAELRAQAFRSVLNTERSLLATGDIAVATAQILQEILTMSHSTSDWAKAHATYQPEGFTFNDSNPDLDARSEAWRKRQEAMPHGQLITGNSFFTSLETGKLYLVHGTSNFEAIQASGAIFASAGCLVGAIYCAQAFPSGNRFRMHNLGDYILHKEVPSILAAHNRLERDSTLLLIEVDLPPNTNPQRIGVDYLRMGEAHYGLYQSLRYLLDTEERNSIEHKITHMLSNTRDFLAESNRLFIADRSLNPSEARAFITHMNKAGVSLPMFGYLYFEALSEYLMLNSTDPTTLALASRQEFNNWLYKDAMYGIYADLRGNFSISRFNPSVEQLFDYIDAATRQGKLRVNQEDMITYIAERIVYWINTRFFSFPGKPIDWLNMPGDFSTFSTVASPLIGHLIHRQLRNENRYKEFYFYFDHIKALEIWNYWNQTNIAIPFSGVFPKGEIGINPAFTNMNYKIYRAIPDSFDSRYITIAEELPLSISPRLVELDKSFMRAGGHYALSKQPLHETSQDPLHARA